MDVNFVLTDASAGSYSNQQPISIHHFQNQMQSLPTSAQHSQAEANFYLQQRQFNATQGHLGNFSEAQNQTATASQHFEFAPNGYLQENDAMLQRQQQQMAVSSPSVSSTADLSGGLANGQNGIRYGGICGGAQHLDSTCFNLQHSTVDGGVGNGDFCGTTMVRQSPQFCAMNGQMLNGQSGGMCFPPSLPSMMMPSPNAALRRTFLFSSDMANSAVKSMQQHLAEDMAGWHLKHCVPSTSRAMFEPKITMNSNQSNSPAPQTTTGRGTKRKASVAQSATELQQPHSMSLSPRDVRPPSYTSSVGHPQSAPILSNHHDQPQHSNELCDSSTNGDIDMFKNSSGQLQSNGAITNYMQNGPFGQMDDPLKKMEIMASKTLNEPTKCRMQRLCSEDDSNQSHQLLVGAVDASKQEKMHKLYAIEKALQSVAADTSPSYPNSSPFSDSSQLRPHFFTPSQIQAPLHQYATARTMGSFPQNHSVKMAMMNSSQQMYNSIGEHLGMMQGGPVMVPPAGSSEVMSQQSWLPQ
uniref:Uncharacterized protein n=1 Tax=Globodera rostochiensis TaxID=31243 RepID=A0A914I8C7_GLORO